MKLAILSLVLLANTALASGDLVNRLKGKYSTLDKDCAFDRAEIRVTKSNGDKILRVKLTNTETGSFDLHNVNLENLWTKVKTTRGIQRIIRQDRLQGNSVISEEKECMLGWIGCSEFNPTATITLVNDETIEATLDNSGTLCSYQRSL